MLLAGCGPKDQESCKAQAAKDANSVAALNVLLADCQRQYPAIRRDDGSYAYYDSVLSEWVGVSGPTLSASDMEKLQRLREQKQEAQAALQERISANRQAAFSKLSIIDYSISCNIDDTYIECYDKNISINIKNDSDYFIEGVYVGYGIGNNVDCSGGLDKEFESDVKIPPHSVGSIVKNVTFEEAGPKGVMEGCVRINRVGYVEGQAG